MDNVTAWGQLAFYAAVSASSLIFAVSHLFKTAMTTTVSSYGEIIAALQRQNLYQQQQIDTLEKKVTAMKAAVVEVVKKVNGGPNGH